MLRITALVCFIIASGFVAAEDTSLVVITGPAIATGVVVKHVEPMGTQHNLTLIASALHPFKDRGTGGFKAEFTGKNSPIEIAASAPEVDLVLLWSVCPNRIKEVALADTEVLLPTLSENYKPRKLEARFTGYSKKGWHTTEGTPSCRNGGFIYADAVVLYGMSGGTMMVNDKLCGIIVGGMRPDENDSNVVWPAVCADVKSIRPLIDQAIKSGPKLITANR